MAIKEILGYADLPASARYPTLSLLGKGVLPSTNQGLTSANTSAILYQGRNWMRLGMTSNSSCYVRLSSLKFTQDEMRTKKIFGGFRYVIPNNAPTKTADPILTILAVAGSVSSNLLVETDLGVSTDEVYIEYMIDFANDTLQVWIDGVSKYTLAVAASAKTTLTDIQITMGQQSSAQNEFHYYNDMYWLVDTSATDNTPSKRLGPIKVKSAVVNAVAMGEGWVVSDGTTQPPAVLDTTTLGPNTELTPAVRTSPNETVSSIGFAKPAAELAIKAVSIEVFGFRDTGTSPTLDAQLKQGQALGTKLNFSVPTMDLDRGAASDRVGCFNLDLNGQPWTPDSIDAIELLVNSKTGS